MAYLKPGDEVHKNGDYTTFEDYNGGLTEGEPVKINASGNVESATEGDTIIGVFYSESSGSDPVVTVAHRGVFKAIVDSSVVAGESLGSPDVAGGETDNTFGHADDQGYLSLSDAVDDGTGTHTAKLVAR
jgi:hypothetical protein